MQPPEVTEPTERLTAGPRDALPEALRRLMSPALPRAVRTRQVVVTLDGSSTIVHQE